MPTAFAITAATTTVQLGAGEVPFTVTNTSGRPLRARLRAVALQPEAQGWFAVAGEPERPFALGETQQVSVRLAVPPQTPAGSYAVRLDAAAEDNPDDDSVQGPSVTIVVPPPPPKKPLPWWLLLVAIAVVVLLVGGGAAFFLLRGDDNIEVPNIAGQPVDAAKATLTAVKLQPGGETPEVSTAVPTGQVIRTDPAAGAKISADEPVDLVISAPKPVFEIPDVSGQPEATARQNLQKAGLTPGETQLERSDTVQRDRVIRTDPAASTKATADQPVNLVVSQGPTLVTLPPASDIIGHDFRVATTTIQTVCGGAACLVVNPVTVSACGADVLAVVSMSPDAGTQVERGSTVTLNYNVCHM